MCSKRAHLQAARPDQNDAGGRHRHGDPQPRDRLSRRCRPRASAAPRIAQRQGGEGGLYLDGRGPADLEPAFRRRPCSVKSLPAQLAAAAPLTGGHDNRYRRGVGAGDLQWLRDGRARRAVAGLPHRVPAGAGGRSHRRGDRQPGQHRSVAASPTRSPPTRWRATNA